MSSQVGEVVLEWHQVNQEERTADVRGWGRGYRDQMRSHQRRARHHQQNAKHGCKEAAVEVELTELATEPGSSWWKRGTITGLEPEPTEPQLSVTISCNTIKTS